jgi:hypothetical protein
MATPNLTSTNLLSASTECKKKTNKKKHVICQQDVPYAEATIQPTKRDVKMTVN